MHDRSHIRRFQLILIPLADLKAELHKVGKRTRRIFFQPRRTVFSGYLRTAPMPHSFRLHRPHSAETPLFDTSPPEFPPPDVPHTSGKAPQTADRSLPPPLFQAPPETVPPGTRHFQLFLRLFFFSISRTGISGKSFRISLIRYDGFCASPDAPAFRKGKVQPLRRFSSDFGRDGISADTSSPAPSGTVSHPPVPAPRGHIPRECRRPRRGAESARHSRRRKTARGCPSDATAHCHRSVPGPRSAE